MPTGKVKWFDNKKGYGFIELDDGTGDIFVHYADILEEGFKSLSEGDNVRFEISDTEKSRKATKVEKL
ncbi:cold-shock protein [candidate division WOR-3 bacterium]|uniref:Cold-shock protein n=1 Tax=candidate division WOR-3 bacterium TaxID=2052148 RepID=A0A9D5K931_UNCW3|nr:cold-shock protein [candidate division WOR-3 bacterium]MBD3364627.1 cold-shock protein [candidate division WOR-3 bacterium]